MCVWSSTEILGKRYEFGEISIEVICKAVKMNKITQKLNVDKRKDMLGLGPVLSIRWGDTKRAHKEH